MKNKKLFTCIWLLLSACSSPVQEAQQEPVVIKNGAVQIAYTKAGSSDTAIVFVHGWAINKSYWDEQVNKLDKQYTVVTLDLGGHGASGHNRESWTINDFAGDVITVIDSLHLNRVILVGHSMGGDVILTVANKIPEKIIGFIGIDNFKEVGVALTPEQNKQVDTFMLQLHKDYKATATGYSAGALFPPNYTDTGSVNRVLRDVANMDSAVSIQAIASAIGFGLGETDLLPALKVPVHLIVSDYTPTSFDSLRKYCKMGFDVKTIHGTGHYPMIEKPAAFDSLLVETILAISKGH